jgi:hypothetical protein
MKNLIYFCFNDLKNFFFSKLLLLTLNNFKRDFEILIISNDEVIDHQNIKKYCNDNKLNFYKAIEEDPYFLRFHIFKWKDINNFNKIFYVDCDIIFKKSGNYFFENSGESLNVAYEYFRDTYLLNEVNNKLNVSPNWWGAQVAKKESFFFDSNWKTINSGQLLFKNNSTIKKLFEEILNYKNLNKPTKKSKGIPQDQPLLNFFLAKNKFEINDKNLTSDISFNFTKQDSKFLHYLGNKNYRKIFLILCHCKYEILNNNKEIFTKFSDYELFLISILYDKKKFFIDNLDNLNIFFKKILNVLYFLPGIQVFTLTDPEKIPTEYKVGNVQFNKYVFKENDENNFDVCFYSQSLAQSFQNVYQIIQNSELVILNEKTDRILTRKLSSSFKFNQIFMKDFAADSSSLDNKFYLRRSNYNEFEVLISDFKLRNLKHYKWLGDSPERIELIAKLSKNCDHITEFGVYSGCSTLAFLLSKPNKLISYDITDKYFSFKKKLNLIAKKNKTHYKFLIGNSTTVNISETDLLFIDTDHTYQTTKIELAKHHSKVKKHIILHDYQSHKGVKDAVDEFLVKNKNFKITYLDLFDDGMIRLTRVSQKKLNTNNLNIFDNELNKINNFISDYYNLVIGYGLFKGLIIDLDLSSEKYKANKILGLYEAQIQEKIKILQKRYNYKTFINLGANSGYYPLGFLKCGLFKMAVAFEKQVNLHKTILKNAKLNNLEKKIEIYGEVDKNFLNLIQHVSLKSCLFLVDIEGDEYNLFDKNLFDKLKKSSIIIEDHSNLETNKTAYDFNDFLIDAAKITHNCEVIFSGNRSLDHISEIQNLDDNRKNLLLSEGRPKLMRWLIFTPKRFNIFSLRF